MVEEVVNSKTRPGSLPRVRGSDSLLRSPNATPPKKGYRGLFT